MNKLLAPLGAVFPIVYFSIGLVQLFATVDGVTVGLGIPAFFAWVIAFFLAWIPIIGTITGIYGAIVAWGWEVWQALALFLGPFVLILGFAVIVIRMESAR